MSSISVLSSSVGIGVRPRRHHRRSGLGASTGEPKTWSTTCISDTMARGTHRVRAGCMVLERKEGRMPAWKGIVGRGFTAAEFDVYVASLVFGAWRPQFVVLHNTGDPTFRHWHDYPGERRMRGLERYYRDDMHWSAGPHLFVADDLIWAFTPLTTRGVHAPSWNLVSWGVEIVGDYDHEVLRSDVKENAIHALATLHIAGGLDPATLKFHKDDPKTTHRHCPGARISKPEFIAAIQARLFVEGSGEHLPDRSIDLQDR
jgi:hypothetical protein